DAATGTQLWAKRYAVSFGLDGPSAIGVSPDGSTAFVTGAAAGHYATLAYDAATGKQLWVTRYEASFGGPRALGVSPDGTKVYVTGESPGPNGEPDYATLAYDAVSGAQLWLRRYNGGPRNWDQGRTLGVS